MRLLIALLLCVWTVCAHAQTTTLVSAPVEPDQRLFQLYESQYLSQLKQENPTLLERWNFYLDHAWYISELPSEKVTKKLPTVVIADLNNVNILLLEKEQNLHRDWDRQMIYRIRDTNKYLIYHSGKRFVELFNQHRGLISKG